MKKKVLTNESFFLLENINKLCYYFNRVIVGDDMKRFMSLFILINFLFLPTVNAKEVNLEASNYTIKPGETMSLDILIDSSDNVKSGSFMITTSSRYIGFDDIEFVDGVKYSSSGSKYTFEVTDGVLDAGSKLATVTLKALNNTKEGAKTTIVLSSLKVKNENGKNTYFDTISQVVTCTLQEQKSSNNYLSEINSDHFKLDNFKKDELEYSVEVESTVDEVLLTANAEDEKSEVKIENTKLENGKTTIKIIVTAENSEERVYSISVKQKEEEKKIEASDKNSGTIKGYKGTWVFISIVMSLIVSVNVFLLKKDK